MSELHDMRRHYTKGALSEESAHADAIEQFRAWFEEALAANRKEGGEWFEANAMTLATASPDGRPSARVVLLKDIDDDGFTYFTNLKSRKGRELKKNPQVALCFYWANLERQVRIEGTVSELPRDRVLAYHASRPRGSQLGAAASHQSAIIESRMVLDDRLASLEKQFEDQPIPCPDDWGGFKVKPRTIEFWQGRPNRLHDRLLYVCGDDGKWTMQRLSP